MSNDFIAWSKLFLTEHSGSSNVTSPQMTASSTKIVSTLKKGSCKEKQSRAIVYLSFRKHLD